MGSQESDPSPQALFCKGLVSVWQHFWKHIGLVTLNEMLILTDCLVVDLCVCVCEHGCMCVSMGRE